MPDVRSGFRPGLAVSIRPGIGADWKADDSAKVNWCANTHNFEQVLASAQAPSHRLCKPASTHSPCFHTGRSTGGDSGASGVSNTCLFLPFPRTQTSTPSTATTPRCALTSSASCARSARAIRACDVGIQAHSVLPQSTQEEKKEEKKRKKKKSKGEDSSEASGEAKAAAAESSSSEDEAEAKRVRLKVRASANAHHAPHRSLPPP